MKLKCVLNRWSTIWPMKDMVIKMEKHAERNGKATEDGNSSNKKPDVKAYKRRWIILTIFVYYACLNAFQWIEYCTITPIVVKYYEVSTLAVDWTSIVYMALYPVLVIPASMIIDKKGLRTAGLIGCIGTMIGTTIKVFSIRRDLFPVVLLGQAIVAASQLVILCLPPKIASIWFQPSEVSTACSLGVFGTQLGCALGYVLPPMIVKDSQNVEEIGQGFKYMCWVLTAATVPVTLAVLFYFPKEPPLPPSKAQGQLRESKGEFDTKAFFLSIKKLFLNKAFNIHMVAYGINIGVFSAIGTLLTQFILQFFEGSNEDAGRMGFVMVIAGMIGSVLFGIFLDKTHKYKETTLFIYFCSALSVLGLIYSLERQSMPWTYVTCALLGTFINAYMPVGFELAMELTFPAEETTTAGILLSGTQLLGVIFTVFLGYLNLWLGCYWSLISQALLLFIGTSITVFVPNQLLRQEAFKQCRSEEFSRRASYHGSKLLFIE